MSTNSTNITIINATTTTSMIVAYYPLVLIVVGTILNLLTLITLCRRPFRDTKKQGVMHYMRTIAIFDILMLYGWNLDHYLSAVYGFTLVHYTIISCKIMSFVSYLSTPVSAWLRVFICLDRYLSLSRLNRTWFSQSKSILIIIGCIIGVFVIFNLYFIIFACYIKPNGQMTANAVLYEIFPLWDYLQLGVYNCGPFIFMVTLDGGVIYHLVRLRRTTTIRNSRVQHRRISITLIMTTFLFLIMTIPASIIFAFFYDTSSTIVLMLVHAALFTYHILSFPIYFITFTDFRREFLVMIRCSTNGHVARVNAAPINGLTTERRMLSKAIGQVAIGIDNKGTL